MSENETKTDERIMIEAPDSVKPEGPAQTRIIKAGQYNLKCWLPLADLSCAAEELVAVYGEHATPETCAKKLAQQLSYGADSKAKEAWGPEGLPEDFDYDSHYTVQAHEAMNLALIEAMQVKAPSAGRVSVAEKVSAAKVDQSRAIAASMKEKGFDNATIADVTGLPLDEIETI